MASYASGTSVSSESSRLEIERTLARYGADDFAYATSRGRAMIGFVAHDRQVRFLLPLPDPEATEFTYTPTRGTPRSPDARRQAYEQAVRQKWRALALMVKAKLEAVESGIVTFEEGECSEHAASRAGRARGHPILVQPEPLESATSSSHSPARETSQPLTLGGRAIARVWPQGVELMSRSRVFYTGIGALVLLGVLMAVLLRPSTQQAAVVFFVEVVVGAVWAATFRPRSKSTQR